VGGATAFLKLNLTLGSDCAIAVEGLFIFKILQFYFKLAFNSSIDPKQMKT
jgi:hypothetical protein